MNDNLYLQIMLYQVLIRTIKEEFASYGFDDTGNKASKEFIIKEGVLQRGLGGLESQERANIEGVANVRACSWNRAPIDRMANLNLEPGEIGRAHV